jgi:hypothetical protein
MSAYPVIVLLSLYRSIILILYSSTVVFHRNITMCSGDRRKIFRQYQRIRFKKKLYTYTRIYIYKVIYKQIKIDKIHLFSGRYRSIWGSSNLALMGSSQNPALFTTEKLVSTLNSTGGSTLDEMSRLPLNLFSKISIIFFF